MSSDTPTHSTPVAAQRNSESCQTSTTATVETSLNASSACSTSNCSVAAGSIPLSCLSSSSLASLKFLTSRVADYFDLLSGGLDEDTAEEQAIDNSRKKMKEEAEKAAQHIDSPSCHFSTASKSAADNQ